METEAVSKWGWDEWNTTTTLKKDQELGKDEFLKLLMTQLKNQDPTSPLQNTEFIAQMAQFSSLEQMNNLVKVVEQVGVNQRQAALVAEATALIGRTVTVEVPDATSEEEGATQKVTGTVASVRMVEGWPKLVIDGQPFDPADVTEVA